MRADRAAFIEFFGGDELVLAPAEAGERINAYYRHRQEAALAAHPGRRRARHVPGVDIPAVELPANLADAGTIGIIFDETDGLNWTPSLSEASSVYPAAGGTENLCHQARYS